MFIVRIIVGALLFAFIALAEALLVVLRIGEDPASYPYNDNDPGVDVDMQP